MAAVRFLALALVAVALFGCRAARPLPPDDLSAPGWTVRQGQAIWKTTSSELAGELIFASSADGSSSLQFIKTPLPLVSAQTKPNRWTVRFIADNQTVSGRGAPPHQILWLHLANALRGAKLERPLEFSPEKDGNWELHNSETGESISGFLNP